MALPLLRMLLLWTLSCLASAWLPVLGSNPARKATALRDSQSSPQSTPYRHTLAVLTMPYTSLDRIANEAILNTALPLSRKLSVVLRCEGPTPSVASLRKYMGEVYSQLWDCVMDTQNPDLPDVVVYPQNLPNTPPEAWVTIQPDLDCVVSHDTILGWISEGSSGRGTQWQPKQGDGVGGLLEHVAAMNAERAARDLPPVQAVPASPWPHYRDDERILFLDDDPVPPQVHEEEEPEPLLAGAETPALFESVAVGGTFDGLHFGHRKLLTLAMSSVTPRTGKLLVGVTADEMLTRKQFAALIPSLEQRMDGVRDFLHRLAPGMQNRIRLVPISDSFGPPGNESGFDALVLSHETLETGLLLNQHRESIGLEPLYLLCTRRTEAYGMSSTALRRLKSTQRVEASSS